MTSDGVPPALNETRAIVLGKVPASWGAGSATPRGNGWHFKDPIDGRRQNVRAEPDAVLVTRDGRTIGSKGVPIDVGTANWQIPEWAAGPGLNERASELASPYVRQIVLAKLDELADGGSHATRWPDGSSAQAVHAFDDLLNDLFRALDGPNGVDAFDAVGDVLLNDEEAAAVDSLLTLLIRVIDLTGATAAPIDLIRHPTWPAVVQAARTAVTTMDASVDHK